MAVASASGQERPGDVLLGRQPPRRSPGATVVFSPFGLGTLDIALASFVAEAGRREGLAYALGDFWPR